MKRFICALLVFIMIIPCAYAEYKKAGPDVEPGEYEYTKYGEIIIKDSDLEEDTLCRTVRDILKNGALNEKMTVEYVKLVKGVLSIRITWDDSAPAPLTIGMYANWCASNVMDVILEYVELDQFWDKVQLIFPTRKGIFDRSMIELNEFGGRYIDPEEIIRQIPD